jgi:hypothetical protein
MSAEEGDHVLSVGGRLRCQRPGMATAWGHPEMGSGAGGTEQGQGIGVGRGRVAVVAAMDQEERPRPVPVGGLQRTELFEVCSREPLGRPLRNGSQW